MSIVVCVERLRFQASNVEPFDGCCAQSCRGAKHSPFNFCNVIPPTMPVRTLSQHAHPASWSSCSNNNSLRSPRSDGLADSADMSHFCLVNIPHCQGMFDFVFVSWVFSRVLIELMAAKHETTSAPFVFRRAASTTCIPSR